MFWTQQPQIPWYVVEYIYIYRIYLNSITVLYVKVTPLVYLLFCACEYTRVYTWDQIEFNDNQTGVCLVCRNQSPVLSSFMIYHWVCNKSNTNGVTIPSGAPEFTPLYFSICSVLCYALQIVVCPYFLFAIVSSVLLWFIASDYPFGIVTIF